MKKIFDEVAQTPLGRVLKKALDAVQDHPEYADALFEMQDQLLPRMRSRRQEFRLSEEAQNVYNAEGATPHVISLARSHNWYAPALPKDFTPKTEYTVDDLRREAGKQLAIRQGIKADDDQFDVAGVSTMQMSRAIISTTKPGTMMLGDKVAWDGYAIPPALEGRGFKTKPFDQSWTDYLAQNFINPKAEVGVIFITSPDSLTGKLTDEKVLRELLDIADKYDIKVVLNQVHATPGFNGSLPEPQTSIIAGSKNPNLVVMTSSTKQLMPYAVPGLEKANFNIVYSPNAELMTKIREGIDNLPVVTGPKYPMRIDPAVVNAGVELFKASDHDFYIKNQQASQDRRLVIDNWMSGHKGVDWYNGAMPDTTYHALFTFSNELLAKNNVKTPQQLYDYILFSTGLDVAPIFDSGPNEARNEKGDISFRGNYSLPEKELKLMLRLMDVAIDKMERGVTLEKVLDDARREGGTRLKADETPAPAPATVEKPVPVKAAALTR